MKNMTKTLAWLLLAAMPMTGAAAETAALQRAAEPVEMRVLERYPSYAANSETGRWTVRANPADALLDRFWTYAKNNSSSVCAFSVEIEGDVLTDVWTPVLRVYYSGSRKLNAGAVCVLADGVRYDFAAGSVEISHDGDKAEMISAPLTKDALAAIDAMTGAEEVSIRLIGDKTYTAELDRDAEGTRARIEAASLNTLPAASELLDVLGVSGYGLWDLSAAAWESEYGFAPAFARAQVVKEIGGVAVDDDFGMVESGDQTKAVKAAQQMLIDAGFMSGSTSSAFGENSVSAAKRAQKFLGLIETGCADAQLERALMDGYAEAVTEETEWTTVGGAAQLTLDRWWFAGGVSASAAPESAQCVFNSDNVLLAADGMIRNVSGEEMKLFTGLKARVIYAGAAAYEATVVCESAQGTALDMSMLPMAQARLVVYAEVPGWLAQEEGAEWTLELECGGERVEFALE